MRGQPTSWSTATCTDEQADEQGQTLPLAGAVYDSLEIGISAHSFGPNSATVYVDDVAISDKPID